MNLVVQVGRVVKDIEVKEAGSTKVANFTMAVDRAMKREGQPEADFINYTAFGKTAEFLGQYAPKGTKLLVKGTMQMNSYTDKEGKTRTNAVVIVENAEFAGAKVEKKADATPAAPVVDEDDAFPFS